MNIPEIELNLITDNLNYLRESHDLINSSVFQYSAQNINEMMQCLNNADQWIKNNKKGYKPSQQKYTLQKTVNLIWSGCIQDAIYNFSQFRKFSQTDLKYTQMLTLLLTKYFQMYQYLYAALLQINMLRVNQQQYYKMINFIQKSDKILNGELEKYQTINQQYIEDYRFNNYAKWVINNRKYKEKQLGNRNQQLKGEMNRVKEQIKQQKPVNENIVSKYEKMLKDFEIQKQKFNKQKDKLKALPLKNIQINKNEIEKLCQMVLRNAKNKKQKQLKIVNDMCYMKIENKLPQLQTIPSVPSVFPKTQMIDKQYKKVKKSQIIKLKNLLQQRQQLSYNIRQEYEYYLNQKIQQLFDPSSQISLHKLIKQSIQKYIQEMTSSNNITLTQSKQDFLQSGLSTTIPFPTFRSQLFLHNIFLGFETNSYVKPAKQYPRQREYLVQVLQSYVKKRILRTKLLFQHDKINLLNFHQYADDIDNYVVIVKLNNQMMIAGYSQQQLNQKSNNTGLGFISSLSNKKTLYINTALPVFHTTKYDQYSIIFGNNQLRIQPFNKQFYSFTGKYCNYYQQPKIQSKLLFGFGQNNNMKETTCQYVGLEIHKVIFQGEQ